MTTTPPIIHQIWIQGFDAMTEKYKENSKEWRVANPNWTYMFWDDTSLETLIMKHEPDALPRYRSYKRPVLRADMGRIIALRVFGGIYLDMDAYPALNGPSKGNINHSMIFEPEMAYVSYALIPAHWRPIREAMMTFPSNYALAGPPNHRFWNIYLDWILSDPTLEGSVRYTGPLAMRQMMRDNPSNVIYFPKSAFMLPSQKPTPQTMGYHGYDSTWVPKMIRPITRNMRYLPYDVLGAIAIVCSTAIMYLK